MNMNKLISATWKFRSLNLCPRPNHLRLLRLENKQNIKKTVTPKIQETSQKYKEAVFHRVEKINDFKIDNFKFDGVAFIGFLMRVLLASTITIGSFYIGVWGSQNDTRTLLEKIAGEKPDDPPF